MLLAAGVVATVGLGALCEYDSRTLARHGSGVPLAWAYVLVVPISVAAWATLGPLPVAPPPALGLLGILVGPPAAALLYVWQRGRHGEVD